MEPQPNPYPRRWEDEPDEIPSREKREEQEQQYIRQEPDYPALKPPHPWPEPQPDPDRI